MGETTRTLWLVRHGQRRDFVDPAWMDTADRPHDCPLSADGVTQARETGARLRRERIDHVFASPMLRAAETAHHIAAALGLPVKIEEGLCECLFLRWYPYPPGNLSAAVLARQFPTIDPTYQTLVAPIHPEDESAVKRRTELVARTLAARYPGNLLLVGHGGSLTAIGWALLPDRPALHPTFCCLIKIVGDGTHYALERDGRDNSHLTLRTSELRLN